MINIIIAADSRYAVDKTLIRQTVVNALGKHKISGQIEIGVNIVGDRKMHELNFKYRGIDSTTDILSFALQDPSRTGFVAPPDRVLRLGDIVISHGQAMEDAIIDGISIDDEIGFLLEHGIDHLLGLHHPE